MYLKASSSRYLFGLFVLSLISIEYIFFRHYALRDIVPYFPANFDQAGYLTQSYAAYEKVLQTGVGTSFQTIFGGLPTSYTFIPQALLFFSILGASRLTALTINFFYFALLQIFVIHVVKSLTKSYLFAFLGAGLILSLKTFYFLAGGLFDFRIDFLAVCLFGIFVTSLLKSETFYNLKWSIITAFLAAFFILARYLGATYVVGILFLIGVVLTASYYLQPHKKNNFRIRLYYLLLAGFLIALFIFPALWTGRFAIYHYYVGGHFLTNEKFIRAGQLGVNDFISNLLFYPKSLLKDHLGFELVKWILVLLGGCYLIAFWSRDKSKNFNFKFDLTLITLLASILIPLLILTIDLSKSPVVIGIITIPIILLTVWLTYLVQQKNPDNKLLNSFIVLMTLIIFCLGAKNFTQFMLTPKHAHYYQELREISKMYEDIGNFMQQHQQKPILYSADQTRGYIIPQVLTTLYYEKHHILLEVYPTKLSNTIYSISKEDAEEGLKNSNVFILNTGAYPPMMSDYPFYIAMNALKPQLIQIAKKEMVWLGDYPFYSSIFRVYVKTTTGAKV